MKLISSLVLSLLFFASTPLLAASRNCTAQEKQDGNAALLALASDSNGIASLIAEHLPMGEPQLGFSAETSIQLVQHAFISMYDKNLRTSLWAGYQLTKSDIDGAQGKDRVNCFRPDPRLKKADNADSPDYKEPIFDQGHIASDADTKDDLVDQVNTYVYSNMSPQQCRFNRGIWLSLEELGRKWADEYSAVYIMSGSVFDYDGVGGRDANDTVTRMASTNGNMRVAVPSHFYKIFSRKVGGKWNTLSILLEHTNDSHGTKWSDVKPVVISSFVKLSDIESKTDSQLFPDVVRGEIVENDTHAWDLQLTKSNLENSCP